MQLNIYREVSVIATVEIDEKTEYNEVLMADKVISCSVITPDVLPIQLDDYIVYDGEIYSINQLPGYQKIDNQSHQYSIRFEAPIFLLYGEFISHLDDITFDYYGDALTQLTLLVNSIKTVDPEWSVGTVDGTEPIYINYDGDYCRQALTKIAEAFKLEFKLSGKQINLVKSVGVNTNLKFSYGRGNGLYTLTRNAVDDENVVNRVYGFGGSKNIDYNYRNGAKRLIFAAKKLEAATPYRTRSGRYTNEEIYPQRTGTVTAITSLTGELFTITDTSIDFDINSYRQEKLPGTVVFKSGELSGYEFELNKYVHATKILTLKVLKETNGYVLPNPTFSHKVGDKYTIVDIRMPQSYIDAAETKLLTETQKYLDENKIPKVSYDLDIDENYILTNGITIKVGDKAVLQDTKLGINDTLRFTGISFPLVNTSDIKATIGNFVPYSTGDRLIATTINNQKNVKDIYRGNAEEARRNAINLRSLRDSVIDPDGNYYTEQIKPGSIETLYLAVGAKGTNFSLNNVSFDANYQGNANSFRISTGQLIHFEIQIDGVGFTWEMTAQTFTGLDPLKKYFVYAKVSRTTLTGTWVVTDQIIRIEDVVGFWHMQSGVLFPVKDGRRDHEFTKGMTYIVGDQITSGIVKSLDGLMFIDLTQGKLKLGDANSGMDWNVTSPGKFTIRGGLVQNFGGVTAPIPVFRGAYVNNVTYYKGDKVTYNGSSYIYINNTPGTGFNPSNTTYWEVEAIKGQDGSSVKILGEKPNVGSLPATGNTIGDGWIVAGFLYSWTGTEWVNVGQFKGDKGDKGDTGDQGPAGTQGPPGIQGIPGTPGANGAITYTWIRYADNASGGGISASPAGKTYIGIAYNKTSSTPSNTPSDYTFSLFVGPQGVAGGTGPTGATLYTWIKYADDVNGGGMSDDPTGKDYIGIAVNKTTQAESTTPTDYTWAKTKGERGLQGLQGLQGETGTQGIPGSAGANGLTSYFHIKYSANSNGIPMSETPNTYIGTYVDFTAADSNTPSDYLWKRFEGIQGPSGTNGIPGTNGSNGQTSYLHIKYSNNGGTTFTGNAGEDPGDYIGQYTDFVQADSNTPSVYTWSKIKGDQGAQGIQGTQGIPGTSSFFHVRYSANASGTPMSTTVNTYIGTVVTNSSTAPTDYLLYTWARLVGAQGATGTQGIPGTNGSNGQTSYLHIKYSNDGGVTFTGNVGEDVGLFIGQYVDFVLADSNTPSVYTWARLAGMNAKRVLYSVNENPDIAPSVENDSDPLNWGDVLPSDDGFVYLSDNAGNLITDNAGNTISVDYVQQYVWSITEITNSLGAWMGWSLPIRLTGRPADDPEFTEFRFAVNGSPTAPPSIASTDFMPNGWSLTEPTVGLLEYMWRTSAVKTKKTLVSNWNTPSRFTPVDGAKGDKGDQGIQGTQGIDGTSSYFHVRYSANANGNPMGTSTDTYIGTAVTNSPTAPAVYTSYTWVRLIGAQGPSGTNGIPGTNGANGQTSYLHIKYSNNGGTTFTGNAGEDPGDFIGQYVDFTPADSNTPSVYTWTKIKGEVGPAGLQGPSGPLPTGGDLYSASKTYVGNSLRVDIVRYNDGTGEKAYVARVDAGSFSGILPTNTSKWNAFGGQYESVATNLFFAQLAFIQNLGVENLKTAATGTRVEITKAGNDLSLFTGTNILPSVSISAVINTGSGEYAGIRVEANGDLNLLTTTGIYADGSNNRLSPYASGRVIMNSSVGAVLTKKNGTSAGSGISAAVLGLDVTTSETVGNSRTFGVACLGNLYVTGEIHLDGMGTKGETVNVNAGGTHMRFVNGLYVGSW